MRHSIMTEKIARRGVRVPAEYAADFLAQVLVRDHASRNVVVFQGDDTIEAVQRWLSSGTPGSEHQGFPVVDETSTLLGVVTRRDLYGPNVVPTLRVREILKRPPVVVYEDNSLREAADIMVREELGRLPVVLRTGPRQVVGMVTRSDLLSAHRRRLDEAYTAQQGIHLHFRQWNRVRTKSA